MPGTGSSVPRVRPSFLPVILQFFNIVQSDQADPQRDVIVQHMRRDDPGAPIVEQWLIFVGDEQRGQADDERRAFVFARLLADLVKRPVWFRHGDPT